MTISTDELKQFIDNRLKKSNGNISPLKSDEWWMKNNFECFRDEIFHLTNFLINPHWPQRLWHILNDKLDSVKCSHENCTNAVVWNTQVSAYPSFCSKTCSSTSDSRKEKFRNTCIERYGVAAPAQSKEVLEKRKENTIAKYGVEHTSSLDSVKAKTKQAFVDNYGVDNPAKSAEVYSKIRKTNYERYGVSTPIQNADILAKRTATNIEKFGVASPTQVPSIKQKQEQTLFDRTGKQNSKYIHIPQKVIDQLKNKDLFIELVTDKTINEVVEETKLDITTLYNYIRKYDCSDCLKKDYTTTSLERLIADFLDSINVEYEQHNRVIVGPCELDIYIPEYKLAIEVGAVYYHGENTGRGQEYHHNKWKLCRDQGITLLTYFDDDIDKSLEVIKSKIRYLTKRASFTQVGARKLILGPIAVESEREFFDKNHIQGFLNNRNYTVGAYYNEKLVAAMCVTNRKKYVEITRFAVDIEYSLPGVFSRLLKKYISDTNYRGEIVSFSDNCHSNGNLYKAAGFVIDDELGPGYYYSKGGRPRENRQKFMKAKIAKKFNIDITGKTEVAIMQELGYNKIWDCGKIKWKLTVN